MPTLERLAVREISARYLSHDERIEIADLQHAGPAQIDYIAVRCELSADYGKKRGAA